MRIAIFYPRNMHASWYTLGGYRETLTRMGHDVTDCPLPGNQPHNIKELKEKLPSLLTLSLVDLVIIAFAEYTIPWLHELYGIDGWKKLKTKKLVRFDESFDREDLQLKERWEFFKEWGDEFSFPAKQDAEYYRGSWEPFGADTTIFKQKFTTKKEYDLGFIGMMYPTRQLYGKMLARYCENLTFNGGPVTVTDLSGCPAKGFERFQTELLADNYRKIKVFFCLPPLSQLHVCKVFEVMASGTFMMYPRLEGEAAKNMILFEDKKHLVYYDQGDFKKNAEQIKYYLEHEAEREAIAAAGCRFVHAGYSLEEMFVGLFQSIGIPA